MEPNKDHNKELEALKRALLRERSSRKEAEAIIEKKSLEIYLANNELKELNQSLELKVKERTAEIEASKNELVIAKDRAEQATNAKSTFLSNMSHEIRTPLNGIIGITNLLIEEDLSDEIKEMFNSIKYSADNLLVIINDILDISKIEAGKITFEKIEFDLHTLISKLNEMFSFKAIEKHIEFHVKFDKEVPKIIVGDKVKLNQVLINLIGNAIKFTEKGKVVLHVGCNKINDDSTDLEFKVRDTGIGIPANRINKIFESYTQSTTDTTRKFGGTGLGLTISQKLIELQGGTINATSVLGKGSEFSFQLCFKKAATTDKNTTEDATKELKSFENLDVLVVEDNKINQFVAGKILKKWGINFDFANNGIEALSFLSKNKYQLVLMDLQMPEMNGYEATEEIRNGKTPGIDAQIPIIGLSADAFSETKDRVLEIGMNDFATKPIIQEELYSIISKYCTS